VHRRFSRLNFGPVLVPESEWIVARATEPAALRAAPQPVPPNAPTVAGQQPSGPRGKDGPASWPAVWKKHTGDDGKVWFNSTVSGHKDKREMGAGDSFGEERPGPWLAKVADRAHDWRYRTPPRSEPKALLSGFAPENHGGLFIPPVRVMDRPNARNRKIRPAPDSAPSNSGKVLNPCRVHSSRSPFVRGHAGAKPRTQATGRTASTANGGEML